MVELAVKEFTEVATVASINVSFDDHPVLPREHYIRVLFPFDTTST